MRRQLERLAAQLDDRDPRGHVKPLSEYADDPVRFCHEVLGVVTWSVQQQVARSVQASARTAVVAAHGVGKTMVAACLALWWFCARGAPVLTTAPSGRQVRELLWRQIRTLFARARVPLPGRLLTCSIDVPGDAEWWAYGFATDDPVRAQGPHAEELLVIVDEAAGVPEWLWETVDGMLTTEGCRLLAIGNPSTGRGQFFRFFHDERDLCTPIEVSALDSPNVKEGRTVIPGLTSLAWVEDKRKKWGEDSPLWLMKVLGKFPAADTTKVIPMDWIEEAQRLWLAIEEWNSRERDCTLEEIYEQRGGAIPRPGTVPVEEEDLDDEEVDDDWDDDDDEDEDEEDLVEVDAPHVSRWERLKVASLDVAGDGPDQSALTFLAGQRIHVADTWDEGNTEYTADRAWNWICGLTEKPEELRVDYSGIGAGVYHKLDRLWEEADEDGKLEETVGDCELVKLIWGAAASDTSEAKTRLDELYWRLRCALNPALPLSDRLAVPPDDEVAAQLNTRTYSLDEQRRVRVETKKQLKKRGARSPDVADSIAGLVGNDVEVSLQ